MGDAKEYQLAISPTWLLDSRGEAWGIALGLLKEAHIEASRESVVQRFVPWCAADALDEHGSERQIPRAPGEGVEQYRQRLIGAWNAWEQAGRPAGILAQLVPVGIGNAEVVQGVSADPSTPSTWGTWYLRVHEPHPFTPPIYYGAGRTYGDGALYGFGSDFALAYTRAVVRKWNASHAKCTGVVVEFAGVGTDIRFAV